MFKVIPEKVLYDKDLPDKAKFLMADIVSFSINSIDCFISNDTWAERYGCSKGTISRLVGILVEKEYVIRQMVYKSNTRQISKRILVAHPNVIYSLSEVSIELKKQLKHVVDEVENHEEEIIQYKRTNLMRDFHKLWK